MMHVNVLVKPASSACNMNCSYCFYQDVANCREVGFKGFLTLERMEQIIVGAMEYAEKSCTFLFQGGEPVLAGLDFYRGVVELEKKHGKPGVRIYNSLQTNGYEVGEEMARFFAENHFLIGVSLDGPESVHDANRRDRRGGGTFARVMETLELFDRVGVEYNILCVVTGENARRAGDIYGFYRERGFDFLQFIPCLDPLGEPRGQRPWSLTPEDYGAFLCALFDEWYRDWEAGRYTSVRLFDDYVHLAMGLPAGTCATSGSCGAYFVIEADGSVYPCDFYVLDGWKLGALGETPLAAMGQGPLARQFLQEGLEHPAPCAACPWQDLCFGGCKRDWTTDAEGQKQNYYCSSFQRFFAHAEPRLRRIADAERRAAAYAAR